MTLGQKQAPGPTARKTKDPIQAQSFPEQTPESYNILFLFSSALLSNTVATNYV